MKKIVLAGLGAMTVAATLMIGVQEADAVVCARGVYRAGCAGYRGAAVVRRPVGRVCRTVWVGGVRTTRCY